jgi:hypothetical protein
LGRYGPSLVTVLRLSQALGIASWELVRQVDDHLQSEGRGEPST